MEMTLAQVAAALGKSSHQVRYLIRHGKLRARKRQNRWVIESVDLPLSDAQREASQPRRGGGI